MACRATTPPIPGNVRTRSVSPKFSVVKSPAEQAEVFLNWGRGYHSNVFAEVLNLFGKRVNDIDYDYASLLKGETSPLNADGTPAGINDHHIHPAEPRTFRVGVLWNF